MVEQQMRIPTLARMDTTWVYALSCRRANYVGVATERRTRHTPNAHPAICQRSWEHHRDIVHAATKPAQGRHVPGRGRRKLLAFKGSSTVDRCMVGLHHATRPRAEALEMAMVRSFRPQGNS